MALKPAPIKVAVLPLGKKDAMPGINAKFHENRAIGQRYARHDEIGTPYCLTVDGETAGDDTVTIRYRDDRRQERIKVSEAVEVVREALASGRR